MKRRAFIKTGLVTMTASASSQLAFGEIIVPMGESITHSEMENFIREMDISMDRIFYSGGKYLKSLIPQTATEIEQNFFRSSLRSLLLIGNFGDLGIKGQAHPWMQKRMLHSAPEVNYSVTSSLDILRNMSEESREDVRSALIDDPDLGDRILETFDLEARSIGVPSARRRQMKVMGNRIVRRLRHSPGMLIDEYVKKSEKFLTACNSDEALEHLFKTQAGEISYSTRRNEAESAALHWRGLNIPEIPVGYNPIISEQDDDQPSKENNHLKTKKRMGLLGVGAILTALGWLFIAISGSGGLEVFGILGVIMGVTVGPILILIALIIILIKAISGKSKA
jgi:hypothetical protein